MDRLLVLAAVLVITALLVAWRNARDGRVRGTAAGPGEGRAAAADIAAVISPSTALTLVEFTAPGCVPCARTKVLLDQVAADRPDVSVVALDVGQAVGLARAHGVMRAPTTLLVTADGRLLGRVAGVPRAGELTALLDDALAAPAV